MMTKTLKDYEDKEKARMPHIDEAVSDNLAAQQQAADEHRQEVDRLCSLSSSPEEARKLYEKHTIGQTSLYAKLRRFRDLLVSHKLVTDRAKVQERYSNKAMYLGRPE